jgi:hypothetical protein
MLTQERLRELLHYDPETGVFTRITSYYKSRIGKVVGTRDTRGYTVMSLDRKTQLAHRLAWLYVHGYWPAFHIDHINGDTEDNRISNLREAVAKQNQENRKLNKNNKTGYRGVSYREDMGRYLGYVKHHREQIYVGSYATAEEASAAVKAKQDELYTHHKTGYSA